MQFLPVRQRGAGRRERVHSGSESGNAALIKVATLIWAPLHIFPNEGRILDDDKLKDWSMETESPSVNRALT